MTPISLMNSEARDLNKGLTNRIQQCIGVIDYDQKDLCRYITYQHNSLYQALKQKKKTIVKRHGKAFDKMQEPFSLKISLSKCEDSLHVIGC